MRSLNPCDFPVDRVMGRKEFLTEFNALNRGMSLCPNLPIDEAANEVFEYRDRSNDEAEDTLREESEYWHGISEVGPEWFFNEE